MDTVDQWLVTRTFHYEQFADVAELMRQKEQQGVSVSLCIPTLNEAATIGAVVGELHATLRQSVPLLDEIAVIDSGSTDRTLELAVAAGASVYRAADILPAMGDRSGKGENLWKALYQLRGDILVFLDADIINIHPRFVAGLVGPLLLDPQIGYVKSFYERTAGPLGDANLSCGSRVTEIFIRPLFSRFFPALTGFVQPLAGEYAARRAVLEGLSFPVGYGVETAHLIDLHRLHGLNIFGQTNMGQHRHRNRSNPELGRMAFAILQVMERRLCASGLGSEIGEGGELLHQFAWSDGICQRQSVTVMEPERPPMREVGAYQEQQGWALSDCGLQPGTNRSDAISPVTAGGH